MRLCAQAVGGVESKLTGRRGEFSQEERGYFNKVTAVSLITLKNIVKILKFRNQDSL